MRRTIQLAFALIICVAAGWQGAFAAPDATRLVFPIHRTDEGQAAVKIDDLSGQLNAVSIAVYTGLDTSGAPVTEQRMLSPGGSLLLRVDDKLSGPVGFVVVSAQGAIGGLLAGSTAGFHTVYASGVTFGPQPAAQQHTGAQHHTGAQPAAVTDAYAITIQAGDTVDWVRLDGAHNVVADDGSFRSGAISDQWVVYTRTFLTPGVYAYYCEAHGGPGGVNMAGVVNVVGPNQTDRKIYLPLVAL